MSTSAMTIAAGILLVAAMLAYGRQVATEGERTPWWVYAMAVGALIIAGLTLWPAPPARDAGLSAAVSDEAGGALILVVTNRGPDARVLNVADVELVDEGGVGWPAAPSAEYPTRVQLAPGRTAIPVLVDEDAGPIVAARVRP